MATQTQVSLEEYLSSSYDYDPEYFDGELREREMPTNYHALFQIGLGVALLKAGLLSLGNIRVKIAARQFRVIDVAGYLEFPSETYPSNPPLVSIEIQSPGDCHDDIIRKCREYAAWGVQHIWLVNPRLRLLQIYSADSLIRADVLELPGRDVHITFEQLMAGVK